jgi:predicted phage-related endonuclease
MTETALTQEELAAAELEGIKPMPEDLVELREESNTLREEIDKLTARRNEIKDTFGKRLEQDAAQGYVLNGKVHARVTYGTRHTVDSKELKAKMPHIWSKFLKVTKYRSITVN